MRIPTTAGSRLRGVNTRVGVNASNADYGAANLGRALDNIAVREQNNEIKRTNLASTQAEVAFLKSKVELDASFDEDDDYSTIRQRYDDGIKQSLEAAAAGIADDRARQEFKLRNELKIAQGLVAIDRVASGREKLIKRGEVSENLNALKRTALGGNDNLNTSIETAHKLLDDAVEMGYYTPETVVNLKQAWQRDVVIERLNALPVDKLEEQMSQDWAQGIPTSQRRVLENRIKAAKEDAILNQRQESAVHFVDDLIERDVDVSDAQKSFRKIKDIDLRKEVEARYTNQRNLNKVAKQERETELSEEYFLRVRRGEISVDDIGRSTMAQMTTSQVKELYAAEKSASDPDAKIKTSREGLADFYEMMGKGQPFIARQYLLDNPNQFDDGDFQSLLRAATAAVSKDSEKAIPAEVQSVLTVQQDIDANLNRMGIKGAKAKTLKGESIIAYDKWQKQYTAENGKQPTDDERNKRIRQLLTKVTYDPKGPFNKVKNRYGFELEEGEARAAMQAYRERNPEKFNALVKRFNDEGQDPTLEEFVAAFND